MSWRTELIIYQYRQLEAERFREWVAAGTPARFVIQPKGAHMGKKKAADDLSDILGDADTPATTKGAKMQKAAAAKAAVAASAAKHGEAAVKPAKVAAAKPAKKAAASARSRGAAGGGKYFFPVASKEREDLKKKVLALVTKKREISTKEAASTLGAETWQVRLVSVELEEGKQIKREKDGNAFNLKAK